MYIQKKNIHLYRLLWGNHEIVLKKPIFPNVPKNTLSDENKTISRICTAPSLDDCLTGIGPTIIGLNLCLEHIHKFNKKIDLDSVTLPFTMLEFCVNRNDEAVMLPGKVVKYVPDAFMSQECWITKPTVPIKVEKLYLIDGKVKDEFFLYEGEKLRYWVIEDSKWSTYEKSPNREFLLSILDATKNWLIQEQDLKKEIELIKGSSKEIHSLDSMIHAANTEKRKRDCEYKPNYSFKNEERIIK